jgi:hypothetical protein
MQKKVLIALFSLLSILLSVVLINLLNTDGSNIVINTKYPSPSQTSNKLEFAKTSWVEEMANSKDSKFSFPVNELFMQIDLKTYIPAKIKSFRLVIDRSDRYSLFCVVQTLSSMDLPYVLEKKNKISSIYVGSKTKKSLDKVVDTLKGYDINSKIIEVWL